MLSLCTILSFTILSNATSLRERDTYFALGFSYEKFNNIKEGATKEEVLQTLGEPLQKIDWGDHTQQTWRYSKNGKLGDIEAGDLIGKNHYEILFDQSGKVKQTSYYVSY